MKWRFVDRIHAFAPWRSICGSKSVSLEEYSLLDRSGRRGVLPETLLLECCVELARWLVIRSSDFRQVALLSAVERAAVGETAGPGERIETSVEVLGRHGDRMEVTCAARIGNRVALDGALGLQLRSLADCLDEVSVQLTWEKLHDPAAGA